MIPVKVIADPISTVKDMFFDYTHVPWMVVIVCMIIAYFKIKKQRVQFDWGAEDSAENQDFILESRDVLMQPKKLPDGMGVGDQLRLPQIVLVDLIFGIIVVSVSLLMAYVIYYEAQFY